MKNNKKGFTLAELLIVVAIIAVLVAISIPIFTAQLRKARLATNQANARAAYAATVAELLDQNLTKGTATYSVPTAKIEGSTPSKKIVSYTVGSITDPITSWSVDTPCNGGKLGDVQVKEWTVAISEAGAVSFKVKS